MFSLATLCLLCGEFRSLFLFFWGGGVWMFGEKGTGPNWIYCNGYERFKWTEKWNIFPINTRVGYMDWEILHGSC